MLKKIGETNKSFKNIFIFDGKLTLTGDLGIDFYDLKNLNFLKTMYNNTTKYHIPQDTMVVITILILQFIKKHLMMN